MSKKRLLVLGNAYMDFSAQVRRAPERGETVLSNLDHSFTPGGFASISALTASKLGTDTVICTRKGDDEYGDKLTRAFNETGIDLRFVVTDKRKQTGVRFITVEDTNKIRKIVYQGANNSIVYDDVETSFISYPDFCMINNDMREDIVLDTVKLANTRGVPVMLSSDLNDSDFDFESLGQLEIFCADRELARKITGIDPVDVNSSLYACVKIANKIRCKYIVLRLGDRGAFAYDGVYSEIIPFYEIDKKDTFGSGYIFSAALAHAYLENGEIYKATAFANAASAFSVSVQGAYQSIPTLDEVYNILNSK